MSANQKANLKANLKAIASLLACMMLSACLATAYAPMAHAASGSDTALSAVKVMTSAKAKKSAPRLGPVSSVQATFNNGDTKVTWTEGSANPGRRITLSWTGPNAVKGLKARTYTMRYATSSDPYNWKAKNTSRTRMSIKAPTTSSYYVQVRANAKYGKKTVHSKWASYYLSVTHGHSTHLVNGAWLYDNTDMIDLVNEDHGKPGSFEASRQNRTPRKLKLSMATQSSARSVEVSWIEPKDSTYSEYAVRYSYDKKMKKAKKVEGTSLTRCTLTNLKKGKRLYVQVCACSQKYNPFTGEWLDSYAQRSNWSDMKSIEIPT